MNFLDLCQLPPPAIFCSYVLIFIVLPCQALHLPCVQTEAWQRRGNPWYEHRRLKQMIIWWLLVLISAPTKYVFLHLLCEYLSCFVNICLVMSQFRRWYNKFSGYSIIPKDRFPYVCHTEQMGGVTCLEKWMNQRAKEEIPNLTWIFRNTSLMLISIQQY